MRRDLRKGILILLIGLLIQDWWAKRIEVSALHAMEQYDDALQQVADQRWLQLADRARDARALLERSSSEQASEIRRLRARPVSVVTQTVTAPAETLTVVQRDTVRSSLGVRSYRLPFRAGTTTVQVDSAGVVLSATHEAEPIHALTTIYQRPDRSVWASTELSEPWSLASQEVAVHLPGPSWWERNDQWIGAVLGGTAVYLLVRAAGK